MKVFLERGKMEDVLRMICSGTEKVEVKNKSANLKGCVFILRQINLGESIRLNQRKLGIYEQNGDCCGAVVADVFIWGRS